jgi:hypothetical protein
MHLASTGRFPSLEEGQTRQDYWGIDYPLDCVGQPEGDEAPGIDDDEELQEAGLWSD